MLRAELTEGSCGHDWFGEPVKMRSGARASGVRRAQRGNGALNHKKGVPGNLSAIFL